MSRYAEAHKNASGPGDARPTALQIVQDEGLVGKLSGKVAIVTGVSAGIGIETAKALKATGMRVFGAVRNFEKATAALKDDLEPGKLELIHLDMNSLDSVRACAKEFLSKSDTLNLLVNNAGMMMCPEGKTADGFELQFGTNHLAHFLLFEELKDTLLKSATDDFPSRVVSLSSVGHRNSKIHFENPSLEGIYEPLKAYGQSKTANIYLANEIERRYGAKNLHATSVMPGGIWTDLQRHLPKETLDSWKTMGEENLSHIKSPAQGAATTLWAAVGKEWTGKGGKYLEDCAVAEPAGDNRMLIDPGHGEWAYDEEKEGKLWKLSCEMVGIKDE